MPDILIIDDDAHINNIVSKALQAEGYTVSQAYSGTEALMLLSSRKPDLILLDLMLPGLSGEELLSQIKDIPVIVVSAKAISRSRRRMGAVVETPSVYSDMTAADNLRQQYRILGMPGYDGIDELLKLVGLEDTGKKKVRDFSLGMRQRLGIAVALCGDPDLLVLDEPVNGLDPQGIIEIRELILKLNRERDITVLISSHILDELARVATHYGFIDNGRIVREISAEELDAACRKCMRITVTDTAVLSKVLDDMGYDYTITDDTQADIYAKPNISQLTLALAKENCEVLSVSEHDESLESYYISLVGGGSNG